LDVFNCDQSNKIILFQTPFSLSRKAGSLSCHFLQSFLHLISVYVPHKTYHMIRFNKSQLALSFVALTISAFALYSFTTLDREAYDSSEKAQNSATAIHQTTSKKDEKKAKKIKVALLLDTSNSMDGLIEQAKSQLWTLVEELAKAKCDDQKPQVEIALYEYGNDRLSPREGYIRMVTPLTYDLDKISEDLFKLRTQGGSEFCGHVIQTAVNQLDWSADG
jgi:hypothetical protein